MGHSMLKGTASPLWAGGRKSSDERRYKHIAEQRRLWRQNTKGRCAECTDPAISGFKRCSIHMQKMRDGARRRKYGLTAKQYQEMVIAQGGTCAICGEVPKVLCVDHKGPVVRGLLCRQCNWGIGEFYDREDLLLAAIAYLRKNRT